MQMETFEKPQYCAAQKYFSICSFRRTCLLRWQAICSAACQEFWIKLSKTRQNKAIAR